MNTQPLPFVHGFCRGLALGLTVLTIFAAAQTRADTIYQWRRVIDVPTVEISFRTVDSVGLAALQGHSDVHAAIGGRPQEAGFAKLYRNKQTGTFRCEIYLARGAEQSVIDHEMKHCLGWVHQ